MSIPDNAEILVADTETTGIGELDKVVELGWVHVDDVGTVLSEVQSIIDPQYPIGPSASGVHGLTNEDCEDFPTIEEFFSETDPSCFGRKLDEPIILVGHRISFDVRFLKPYVNVVQEVCTLRWARKLYPFADDHKLSTLMFALGLPRPQGAHRVMSDIMSALYLARHICERTGMNLRQLAEASVEPMFVEVMPFGKHKGTPMREVDKGWIRWALREMKDLDPDLKFTFEQCVPPRRKEREPA